MTVETGARATGLATATAPKVPKFDLADRMRKAMREADLNAIVMADYLGVKRETISRWINGKVDPSVQTMRLWATRTGVDYDWLRTGLAPRSDENGGPNVKMLPHLDSNQKPADYLSRVRRGRGFTRPRQTNRPHGLISGATRWLSTVQDVG